MSRRVLRVLALLMVFMLVAGLAFTGCEKKEPLKITMLSDDGDTALKSAAALQEMWRTNLGIEVEIVSLPFAARLQKMTDKDFQMVFAGWGPDYNDPMTFLDVFLSGGGNNHTSYSNPQFDLLINNAKKEVDKTKRMNYLVDAEKLLMEDMPIAPVYFRMRDWCRDTALTGVVRRSIGGDPDLYWATIPGNELRMNLGDEPPELDPQLTTDTISMQVINSMMEGLYRYGNDGKMIPGMATSYTMSADGKKYTFTLREGAKWSNGDPVTADDFLFAIQRAADPETASQYSYILYDIKGFQEINEGKAEMSTLGVKVEDGKLVVELDNPIPYFISLTAFATMMPCNRAFFEANEADYGAEAGKLLYNGPWKITEWAHASKLVMEKNEDYWNKSNIKLNKITGYMIADSNTSVNMFYNKELDLVGVPGTKRQEFKDKGYTIEHYSDGACFYLEFNLTDPIMKNDKIRTALSYAIDRVSYCKDVLANDSLPALAYVVPGLPGLTKDFRAEVGDLLLDNQTTEAKKLYAEGEKEVRKDIAD